ncbi:MAG: flavodoxin [Dorea sp.]
MEACISEFPGRKSLLLLTLVMSFGFVLAACGNSNSSAETSSAADETVSEEPAEEQETTDTNGENVLIAYFSYTGNTEEVAQMIAEYTGGDLAEIQRAEEYGDLQEEAETEILDGVHPEITVSVDNVEEYDTIFVGYPIWLAYHKLIQCTLGCQRVHF